MLLVAEVERTVGPSLLPKAPTFTSWSDQEVKPAFAHINATGAYAKVSGTPAIYDCVSASLPPNVYRGTGGKSLFAAAMQSMASASGAYIVVQSSPRAVLPIDSSEATPMEVGRQLALARHYFSLNPTDLSRVLLVERPTVYAWLDGKWEPKQENRGRIRKLHQLVRLWQEMSKQPVGKFLREPVDGELSLMDHLVREPLEMATINRVLVTIHNQVDRKTRTKRVRSVRSIAKQRGFKPLSFTQEDERFDQVTRF